jgi:hypothetical protein
MACSVTLHTVWVDYRDIITFNSLGLRQPTRNCPKRNFFCSLRVEARLGFDPAGQELRNNEQAVRGGAGVFGLKDISSGNGAKTRRIGGF